EGGVDVQFTVADATSLEGFEGRFDSVLDAACYHCLTEDARHAYAAALHRATRPDALLTLFAFPAGSGGLAAVMGVSEENLRTTWGKAGWDITDLQQARYHANAAVSALLTSFGLDSEPVSDDSSRIQIPIWALQAQRA
ncbi:MAG: class I SAM-dependent methyltransferase, partial [Acidimicrobiia bacterium]